MDLPPTTTSKGRSKVIKKVQYVTTKVQNATTNLFKKKDSKNAHRSSVPQNEYEDVCNEVLIESNEDECNQHKEESKTSVEAKRRAKLVDPFKTPPSRINKATFILQNPFIEVIDNPVCITELENKVQDGKEMMDSALKEAMREMVGETRLNLGAYKTPSSEIGGRPHHNALAGAFWLITRPYCSPIYATLKEYKEAANVEGITSTSASADNQEDLKITQKKVDLMGKESNESLDVRQEGDDGELMETRVRYVFNFVVHDRNIKGPNNEVTTLIVDGTWNKLTHNKMYQVASYGCKYAVKNMDKGRLSPLYLDLWGESKWRYGILYPSGVVVVEKGKVVMTTLNCSSIEALQRMLDVKEGTLHANFPMFDGTFPDGSYVEGTLYLSRETFSLPNCTGPKLGF